MADSSIARSAIFGSVGIVDTCCKLFQKNFRLSVPCAAVILNRVKQQKYHSEETRIIEEARKLIESGFTFVCDMEDAKLFSKRK